MGESSIRLSTFVDEIFSIKRISIWS